MICTLGSVVFVSILVIRGIWTGVSYVQENRNHTGNELGDDHRAWTGTQPATWSAHHPINTKVSKDERKKKISCMLKENKPRNSWILEGCRQICSGLWDLTSFSSIVSDNKCGIHTFLSKLALLILIFVQLLIIKMQGEADVVIWIWQSHSSISRPFCIMAV